MRVPIREQLSLLVLSCSLLSLMVLALATWFQSRSFITSIRLSGLSLTASLKAAQLSATLLLYESQTRSVATRVLIQSALDRYRKGNNTNENFARTQSDLAGALANGRLLVQASVFPAYQDGNTTTLNGLVNVTSDGVTDDIVLPYRYPNGSQVYLGDPGLGYPPDLYPNLTYSGRPNSSSYTVGFNGKNLNPNSVLIIGPLILDDETALLSATTGIMNNTLPSDVLGWLTVVINASMVFDVRDSPEGLGDTGEVLIIGPEAADNQFSFDVRTLNDSNSMKGQEVRFILPPSTNGSLGERHSQRATPVNAAKPFLAESFPALVRAWTYHTNNINNAGAMLDTHNEENQHVAVGFAQTKTPLVDWVLVVEQGFGETVAPINHLRDIVLICVFSVAGGLAFLTFPMAHYWVAPIRQLRAATRKTVEPYQPDDNHSGFSFPRPDDDEDTDDQVAKKEGFFTSVTKWATNASPVRQPRSHTRRTFRIPSKVPERRHIVYDELTDLITKFNEMSDELTMQYQRLEERVKERTAELEKAKQAAEAANQSKTLFIANISHELKTPLNGILGLAQICMGEDDLGKIRSTLSTIYKSGDLLLHLLTDLLTFSKNEVGQQLSIDEAEFRLIDLSTQLLPTFDRQAKDGQIKLQILYYGTHDSLGNPAANGEKEYGPAGTGRVRDMGVWGDKNRILQVLMNFTSNSLKFTPPNGTVTIRIRCVGLSEPESLSRTGSARKSSLASRKSKSSSRKRVKTSDTSLVGTSDSENEKRSGFRNRLAGSTGGSDSEDAKRSMLSNRNHADGKLSINLGGATTQIDKVVDRTRSKSPPPLNTKNLDFEFEVEDTGPGIPEDQQRKIFEPFVQGDLGLSKKYGGTGLGLSICAQLAALMGGELSLDSEVGRGSKFTMRIPLRYISEQKPSLDSQGNAISHSNSLSRRTDRPAIPSSSSTDATYADVPRVWGLSQPFVAKEIPRPKPQHSPASDLTLMKKVESEAAKSGSKVRVLVAEDNKINQEVVLRMLKLEDVYDVTIAKDGQEAYELVRESMQGGPDKKFHLVFMDVQMPNVDGIQSTKMIRGMGFSAPIVALTAFAEKSNEDECMASGMDYFLAKPIKRPALKQVLKKYCATIAEEEGEVDTPNLLSQSPRKDTTEDSQDCVANGVLGADGHTDLNAEQSNTSDFSAKPSPEGTEGSATSNEEKKADGLKVEKEV